MKIVILLFTYMVFVICTRFDAALRGIGKRKWITNPAPEPVHPFHGKSVYIHLPGGHGLSGVLLKDEPDESDILERVIVQLKDGTLFHADVYPFRRSNNPHNSEYYCYVKLAQDHVLGARLELDEDFHPEGGVMRAYLVLPVDLTSFMGELRRLTGREIPSWIFP